MQRIKISLPQNYVFSTIITVRITDLNYGGHVGNDVFLSLIHEARMQFLQHFGYSELNFAGTGLIMADAAIEFKRELSYGNQIKISIAANDFDKLGFDIVYLLEVLQGENLITAGKAKTGMTCYDYINKKRVAMPAEAIEKLTQTGS